MLSYWNLDNILFSRTFICLYSHWFFIINFLSYLLLVSLINNKFETRNYICKCQLVYNVILSRFWCSPFSHFKTTKCTVISPFSQSLDPPHIYRMRNNLYQIRSGQPGVFINHIKIVCTLHINSCEN